MSEYYDLGDYSRHISTASPDAQLWFDRGLVWTYGYHHEEAVVCFKKSVEYDPACVMAHWGIAYASIPIMSGACMACMSACCDWVARKRHC